MLQHSVPESHRLRSRAPAEPNQGSPLSGHIDESVRDLEARVEKVRSALGFTQRAFVIEFAGTPKSGKSTSVEAIRHFFARNGFRVRVLAERAAVCPIPMKGHLFFNTWCASTMLAELLVNVEADADIILVDRFLDLTAPILKHRVFVRTIAPSWARSRALTEQYSRTALQRVVEPTLSDWFGVAPKPGDAVIEKFRYSAFEGTALDGLLRANRTETLIVAGATTDVCVDSTVRAGFMHDYGMIVLSDCTGASTPERHNHTLSVLNQFFAICAPNEDVIRRVARLNPKARDLCRTTWD